MKRKKNDDKYQLFARKLLALIYYLKNTGADHSSLRRLNEIEKKTQKFSFFLFD